MKKIDETFAGQDGVDFADKPEEKQEKSQNDDNSLESFQKAKERKPRIAKKIVPHDEPQFSASSPLQASSPYIEQSQAQHIAQQDIPVVSDEFVEKVEKPIEKTSDEVVLPQSNKVQDESVEKNKNRQFDNNRYQQNQQRKHPYQKTYVKKPISEMNLQELVHYARRTGILGAGFLNKQELTEKINYLEARPDLEIDVEGVLEKLPDGFGFLRSAQYDYTSSPDDVYVSPSQIRRFGLRNGDIVRGVMRKLREEERFFALLKVTQVNYEDPMKVIDRPHFDNLIPVYPHDKFNLEFDPTAISTRLMDLFTPIGKGQRGLIVAPPKVGKTMLLKELARSIITNHPETFLIVLHIDERPEEVADMRRIVKGARAEVISSTFDETAERHVQVAEIALEKAKRLVESGFDVVILLDSITRLARAYNTIAPASGKVLTGGIDANALQRPKRFFGAARCAEKTGSSLTIIASALVETGSKMDEVIFEEFKGTGNMEINLTRKLSNRRVFPAFDLLVSGTRRDDLLLSEETLNKVWVLQKFLGTMNTNEGMEFLIEKIKKTKTNDEFLESMTKQSRMTNGSSTPNG